MYCSAFCILDHLSQTLPSTMYIYVLVVSQFRCFFIPVVGLCGRHEGLCGRHVGLCGRRVGPCDRHKADTQI